VLAGRIECHHQLERAERFFQSLVDARHALHHAMARLFELAADAIEHDARQRCKQHRQQGQLPTDVECTDEAGCRF